MRWGQAVCYREQGREKARKKMQNVSVKCIGR